MSDSKRIYFIMRQTTQYGISLVLICKNYEYPKVSCKYVTPNKNNVLLRIGCRGNAISCFTADDSLKRQLQSFEVGDYINIIGNIV